MSAYFVSSRGLASRMVPRGALSPLAQELFGAYEPGSMYDPEITGTLFQDAAGTTPVTAVEQPVGGMLDLSGRGNHASMATTTKRPVLSRRVNLLTESEFRNGVVDAPTRGGLISASTLPGYLGAIEFAHDGLTNSFAYKAITGFSNTPVIFSLVIRMDDGSAPRVNLNAGPSNDFRVVFNGVAVVPSQQEIAPGVYRLTASATITSGGSPNFGVVKYGNDSTKTFKVTAYDLRLATDAHLPYQWVNTATDYDADPAKFPAYLRFDGVDDALQTGNIDFTSTDKMTVWAGVTALDMGADNRISGVIVGNGFGTFNAFSVIAPNFAGVTSCASAGSTSLAEARETGLGTSPRSMILTLSADQTAPYAINRRDSVQRISVAVPQGGGGYGNKPLLLGVDLTTRFFTGRIYQLIVRGAQSSLSQIEATELYIKQKMRLP